LTRLTLLTLLVSAVLVAGCNGDEKTPKAAPSTPPTTASTVSADGTATPGTVVRVGQRAVVRWRADKTSQSLLAVTVQSVKRGAIGDLKQFKLGRAVMASHVYYVSVLVKNTGTGNLSGKLLPLFGKVSAHLVVPPVRFTLPFPRCEYRPLPAHFKRGARAHVCMVMLAPKHGRISAIEWRSPRLPQPVSWRVR
jgi:hypothetical protein